MEIPFKLVYLAFPRTTLSDMTEIFGSTKMDSRIVATPFIRPDAIIAVLELSCVSSEAYSADSTPIVQMAVTNMLNNNSRFGISQRLIPFKQDNLGNLKCLIAVFADFQLSPTFSSEGTDPSASARRIMALEKIAMNVGSSKIPAKIVMLGLLKDFAPILDGCNSFTVIMFVEHFLKKLI